MVAISIIEGTSLHLKIFKCLINNFHISRKKILQGYNIFSAIFSNSQGLQGGHHL
jgi:hypothetical protein